MGSDPLPLIISLIIVLLLVLLNGFFVAAEFAMVKVRSSRIDTLVQDGDFRARFAKTILENLNAYLSACQLGITLASLALGWIGEPVVLRMIGPLLENVVPSFMLRPISFIIAFSFITAFHITIGEQVPKTYAIRHSEQVTLLSAIPMVIFYKSMYPFIWLLNGTSNWMLRRAGIEPEEEHEAVHTEEEIRGLMQESHKSGYIDKTEMTLVDNVFEFTETNAREIMIPRTEMVCLFANMPFAQNKEIAVSEVYTRYPVCDPDKDNIIGFVHIKDLIKAGDGIDDIRQIARPLITIPDSMPISALLRLLQKQRTEMALLIDEYGGTSGLVTVEDIIEELVGEIHDEFDDARVSIEKRDELTHSVDGLLNIEEFNTYFGTEIETENYDTISGFVYSHVEMPPRKHQRFKHDGLEFIVEEVDQLRISRLLVRGSAHKEGRLLEGAS